jgi:hypothetical protein
MPTSMLTLQGNGKQVTTLGDTDLLLAMTNPASLPDDAVIAWSDLQKMLRNAVTPGYIQENSAQLLYVGTQAYSVLPGSAIVNGSLLTWAANIARTGVTMAANAIYYVYLYDNAGVAAVEESTTVPVWSPTLNYFAKTGDATRRCIGYLQSNNAAQIRTFLNTVTGRVSEFVYTDGENPGTSKRPVNGGTVSTSWASFSLAPLVPVHATHWFVIAKLSFATIGDEAVLGLSPIDLGVATANFAPFQIRDKGNAAAAAFFVGGTFLPIQTSQVYYYRLQHNSGTTATAIAECQGAKIIR